MATDATLTLTGPAGLFVFQRFEIPEWVHFGGPFRYQVHRQPGGATQIDSMGAEDHPISWDGIMLSADGDTRANFLWQMFLSGDKNIVNYGQWTFAVVISDLKIQYKAKNYVKYHIQLTRVIDAIAPAIVANPNDLGNAADVPGGAPT